MANPPKPCKIAAKSPEFIAKIHGILESNLVSWRIPRILCKKHLDLDISGLSSPEVKSIRISQVGNHVFHQKMSTVSNPIREKMCFHIRISFPSVSSVHSQYHPYFMISIFYKPFTRTLHKNRHNFAMFSPCFPWPWRWWARLQTALFFPGFAPCGPPGKGADGGQVEGMWLSWMGACIEICTYMHVYM